uniref:C2H2-type domain-containing protein n=1 Tax=Wuchereria bancrofti TaxID=6293 RepID=A0AAF5PZI6_WUCBA
MALLQLKVIRGLDVLCFVSYQRDEISETAAEGQYSISNIIIKRFYVSAVSVNALVWFVAYLSVRHFILAIRLASSVFVCRCIHEGENVKGEWKCLSANLATRNREARRRQRENPKFREAERARARAYYMSLSSTATNEGIICDSCGLIVKHVKALRTHRAEFHPRQFEELREYVLETEKNVEKLAVYGAASSNSMEEQKLSIPSDLISMLKDFILHRIPPESSGLTGIVEKSNETGKIGGN